MACFKDKTKEMCGKIVMLMSVLLLIIGLATGVLGYTSFSGKAKGTSDKYNVDFSKGIGFLLLFAGLFTMVTGCLGFCAGKWKKCIFTFPFMIFSFIIMILCLIGGAVSFASTEQVKTARDDLCKEKMGDYSSITEYAAEVYLEAVDKVMCS
jgi:ABC-type transport system involved in multi-copper enzyme maturation permease subunit